MPTTVYHIPVLLKQSVDGLNIRRDGVYADLTFGVGGHSREILSRLNADGRLYSFDQDADAESNVPANEERLTFVRSNFRYLPNWMRYYGVDALDGILADLGVSSHHFDDETRGFSFRFNGPLDMRMNGRAGMTAADVVNTYDEEALAKLFLLYGEMKNGRSIAKTIVKSRSVTPLKTVEALAALVEPLLGRDRTKKDMAKVFQALRIEVNHEMDALEEMLEAAGRMLRPGGRLVVLTYHSLEDRMVKNYMRSGRVDGKVEQDFFGNRISPMKPINNKVIVADAEEQERNPRSRSAKLRIAERLDDKQAKGQSLYETL